MPAYSPLARGYYDQITGELNAAISQSVSRCEARPLVSDSPAVGLNIRVAASLDGSAAGHSDARADAGLATRLSVPFNPDSGADGSPDDPYACTGDGGSGGDGGGSGAGTPPWVPLELFMEPIDFGYVIYGPGGGNYRWEWRDPPNPLPAEDPYFMHYARTLRFFAGSVTTSLGSLHLVIDQMADLWLRFQPRPIPPVLAERVDLNQALRYEVSPGGGYFNIAAAIEVRHVESGLVYSRSLHGNYAPGYLPSYGGWPNGRGWENMAPDASGVIRHHHVDVAYSINTLDPAVIGLPLTGTYRMRYILLAVGYQTYSRQVTCNALGLGGDTRMSWKSIWLSHMPTQINYTHGMSDGIVPPFEYTYTLSPVLASGIDFDAQFDLKNITTFRFVVKVGNRLDFALGVVVQASGWQGWVRLEPGEVKYLAGAVSISGMANWNAYPLHPASPNYGWQGSWGGSYISMSNGQCSMAFNLYLTAPDAPETTPANLPALRATQRWYWDLASWGPHSEPVWGAIKKFAPDGRYDYEYALQQFDLNALVLTSLRRSISQPSSLPLINPATYFATGYQTVLYDWSSPWHKRPWPGSGSRSAPIMINGEQQTWNGSAHVWTPVEAVSISLTRTMMQQVAAMLGVTEYVVMDGDDMRWFVPVTYNPPTYPESFANVLWIDRFYTRDGALIDDAAMRAAFQTVIANNAGSWPNYRALVIHPAVRFGSFLDNGGAEVGEYLLNDDGDMHEVSGFADLTGLSTRFLYHIKPDFQ